MHRLRYRIFKERLGWDVQVSGDMEINGECFAGQERQGHEHAAAGGLLLGCRAAFHSRAKAATRL
jgi:hypothetical protein